MVRALVEPFGHVAELFHSQHHLEPGNRGEAIAVYCCRPSASLARLALHGLVVGRSRIQAATSRSLSLPPGCVRDGETDRSAATAGLTVEQSQTVDTAAPRCSQASSSFESLARTDATCASDDRPEADISLLPLQSTATYYTQSSDPWRSSYHSASIGRALHDPVFGDKVSAWSCPPSQTRVLTLWSTCSRTHTDRNAQRPSAPHHPCSKPCLVRLAMSDSGPPLINSGAELNVHLNVTLY